jgi:hypothetical protein
MRSDWRGGLRFDFSHPCAEKKAQGWGTEILRLIRRRTADPSTALRFAQDDRFYLAFQDGIR